MPAIRQLEPHVADLIAAGEVVERPASVVKELMENAIDAGANAVTVEIAHGGMSFIRVTDDGCGIPADQVQTAFLRHATSKISNQFDLEAIGTLGFRGEALAAIAAVSRVELLTRPAQAELGAALTLEGGKVLGQEEAGCPLGTTLVVRDLFFNTPARQKFLKKDAAEGAAVFAVVQRAALSHPELSVKFIRDGRQELLTPGDGQLKSAVYAVMGRDIALGLLPVAGSGPNMSVSGFTSMPVCCRGSRSYQHFFVNGRYVKSRTMMAALEEAYANQKVVGKFPGCVLHLTTRLNAVDVNVHPTKQEVKFGSDKKVFDAVYYAVKSTLEADRTRPSAVVESPAPRLIPKQAVDTVTPNQTSLPLRDTAATRTAAPYVPPAVSRPAARPAAVSVSTPAPSRPARPAYVPPVRTEEPAPAPAPKPAEEKPVRPEPVPAPVSPPPQPQPQPQPEEEPWRLAGEVLNTYIIVEQGDKVLLIDKHAAHERMNFDRLKAAGYQPMVQSLLTPVVFTPPAEEGAALLSHLPLLARFGFEAEDFGGGAVIVRSAPSDVAAGEIPDLLLELAGKLLTCGTADPEAARDALLHTMACKAAIKGGQKNDRAELEKVARAVMAGEVKYCPHGRPVAIELTRGQLEKRFGRA